MKIFFDTEFTGLHKDTTLISIGLVTERGEQFYAEFTDYDEKQCDSWVKENVIKKLLTYHWDAFRTLYVPNFHVGKRSDIRFMLSNWLAQFDTIDFVSDVCHYDFVLLIDLLAGYATNLEKKICPACHDINQDLAYFLGISEQEAFNYSREDLIKAYHLDDKVTGENHNALYDAKIIRLIYINLLQERGLVA